MSPDFQKSLLTLLTTPTKLSKAPPLGVSSYTLTTAYQPPFLAQIQCHTRSPLAAPTSRTEDKEGTSLANMIREDLVAEHIVMATYREIVTNFA